MISPNGYDSAALELTKLSNPEGVANAQRKQAVFNEFAKEPSGQVFNLLRDGQGKKLEPDIIAALSDPRFNPDAAKFVKGVEKYNTWIEQQQRAAEQARQEAIRQEQVRRDAVAQKEAALLKAQQITDKITNFVDNVSFNGIINAVKEKIFIPKQSEPFKAQVDGIVTTWGNEKLTSGAGSTNEGKTSLNSKPKDIYDAYREKGFIPDFISPKYLAENIKLFGTTDWNKLEQDLRWTTYPKEFRKEAYDIAKKNEPPTIRAQTSGDIATTKTIQGMKTYIDWREGRISSSELVKIINSSDAPESDKKIAIYLGIGLSELQNLDFGGNPKVKISPAPSPKKPLILPTTQKTTGSTPKDNSLTISKNTQPSSNSKVVQSVQSRTKGNVGEIIAGANKQKETLIINGNKRIPDILNRETKTIGEVKFVKKQSLTQQIKDDIQFAKDNGFTFELYINGSSTKLSKPLQDAVKRGDIQLKDIFTQQIIVLP